MTDDIEEIQERFIDQLQNIDELAITVLKGHLLIEELISEAIEKYVHHPEHFQKANLRFAQKVSIARSMSLSDEDNSMWNLINSINSLRNELAHAIDSPNRIRRIQKLKGNYIEEIREHPRFEELREVDDITVATLSISMSLGFLHSFSSEIDRFKGYVNALDFIVNPHLQNNNGND